ncbi:UNKNOWN [Stylonychia lemnae]|uniref:Uncharacterized protein n=1 Tax=Stylonychia lemnae TaxID=5949 RepID=A0A078AXJ1_STYLE|nr:UNKNOWN [Stylonychia lemnae]|eukprot:CDW85952.1 UNKNOWN [Stylonychia lemnae]
MELQSILLESEPQCSGRVMRIMLGILFILPRRRRKNIQWYFNQYCNKTDGILSNEEECDDGDVTHSGGIVTLNLAGLAFNKAVMASKDALRVVLIMEQHLAFFSAVTDEYFSKFKTIKYYYNTSITTEIPIIQHSTDTTIQTQTTTQFATPMPSDSSTSPSNTYTTIRDTTTSAPLENDIVCGNGILEFGEECDVLNEPYGIKPGVVHFGPFGQSPQPFSTDCKNNSHPSLCLDQNNNNSDGYKLMNQYTLDAPVNAMLRRNSAALQIILEIQDFTVFRKQTISNTKNLILLLQQPFTMEIAFVKRRMVLWKKEKDVTMVWPIKWGIQNYFKLLIDAMITARLDPDGHVFHKTAKNLIATSPAFIWVLNVQTGIIKTEMGKDFNINFYSCSKDCQVEWGYSIEIHKIQGSEFNMTIHYDAALHYETQPPPSTTLTTQKPQTTTYGPGTQTTETTFQTIKPTVNLISFTRYILAD